jgi:hypothetical protein
MLKHTRGLRPTFLVITALASVVAACGGGDAKDDTTALGADSALTRDLSLANRDSLSQPQLRDVPSNAPAASTPRSTTRPASGATKTPPASRPTTTTSGGTVVTNNPPARSGSTPTGATGGAVGVIPAGTTMDLASSSKICTDNKTVGDRVTATTTEALTGSNGVSIPAGATVTLEVTRLKRSENVNDPVVLEFRVVSLASAGRSYSLNASVTGADVQRVRDQPKDKDVQKVVGGAIAGAIAGQIIGKNTKSTVIGAAAGAAAGAGAAAATANYQGCINAGNRITVRLDGPVEVIRAH